MVISYQMFWFKAPLPKIRFVGLLKLKFMFIIHFKEFLCLPIYIDKIGVEPAAREKIGVCNPAVLPQIIQRPLSPYAIVCYLQINYSLHIVVPAVFNTIFEFYPYLVSFMIQF